MLLIEGVRSVENEHAVGAGGAVGKEKVCYWLSNDIVGLVGNLAV